VKKLTEQPASTPAPKLPENPQWKPLTADQVEQHRVATGQAMTPKSGVQQGNMESLSPALKSVLVVEPVAAAPKYVPPTPEPVPVKMAAAPAPPATVNAAPTKEKSMWFSVLIGSAVGLFKGWFAKEIPTLTAEAKAELGTVEDSLIAFAKTDLGKLAVDAVNMAKDKLQTGDEAFATAKAQFITDAKTAGHDISAIGSGIVDWMIQSAYTIIAGVVAQTPKP
jgi:hypothetical protein